MNGFQCLTVMRSPLADSEEKSTQGSRGEKQTPKNLPKNQTDSPQEIPPNKTWWMFIDLCDSINKQVLCLFPGSKLEVYQLHTKK